LDDGVDAGEGIGVDFLAGFFLGGVDGSVGDDEDGLLDVVEDDEVIVDAEEEIGEMAVVAGRMGEFFGFEVADGIVGGIADGTADERGKDVRGGEADALEGLEEIFEVFERIRGRKVLSRERRIVGMFDGDLCAVGFDDGAGIGGDEGITRNAFAADDGFKEEGVASSACGSGIRTGEAFVGGDRGEVIGEEGAENGDDGNGIGRGGNGGQRLEFLEGRRVGSGVRHGGTPGGKERIIGVFGVIWAFLEVFDI
jgi:hypothetical protein